MRARAAVTALVVLAVAGCSPGAGEPDPTGSPDVVPVESEATALGCPVDVPDVTVEEMLADPEWASCANIALFQLVCRAPVDLTFRQDMGGVFDEGTMLVYVDPPTGQGYMLSEDRALSLTVLCPGWTGRLPVTLAYEDVRLLYEPDSPAARDLVAALDEVGREMYPDQVAEPAAAEPEDPVVPADPGPVEPVVEGERVEVATAFWNAMVAGDTSTALAYGTADAVAAFADQVWDPPGTYAFIGCIDFPHDGAAGGVIGVCEWQATSLFAQLELTEAGQSWSVVAVYGGSLE